MEVKSSNEPDANVAQPRRSGPIDRKVSLSTLIITISVIIVVVIVVFTIYYIQTSTSINDKNTQIALLTRDVSGNQSQVSSLQSQLAAVDSQLKTLQNQASSSQSLVTSLQNQLATYKSQNDSLQGKIALSDSQITNFQSQIASLQNANNELNSILNLSKFSVKANALTIYQNASASSLVASFPADYAGYIVVTGASTTATGYLTVTNSFSGYPYNNYDYYFGANSTVLIPVLPGVVSVYFGNHNVTGPVSATLTVTYYY